MLISASDDRIAALIIGWLGQNVAMQPFEARL